MFSKFGRFNPIALFKKGLLLLVSFQRFCLYFQNTYLARPSQWLRLKMLFTERPNIVKNVQYSLSLKAKSLSRKVFMLKWIFLFLWICTGFEPLGVFFELFYFCDFPTFPPCSVSIRRWFNRRKMLMIDFAT